MILGSCGLTIFVGPGRKYKLPIKHTHRKMFSDDGDDGDDVIIHSSSPQVSHPSSASASATRRKARPHSSDTAAPSPNPIPVGSLGAVEVMRKQRHVKSSSAMIGYADISLRSDILISPPFCVCIIPFSDLCLVFMNPHL